VISGSVEIGVAAGTLGVLGAFSKGAPVRIIGSQATGAADFWYVPANSKIQKLQDVTPETTIAYSTNGSSTNSVALGFLDQYKLKAKLVATGSPSATFTPVMSGQVDVGWSSPPFGFDALKEGKIRIIARANDVEAIRTQSIRTLIANARFVDTQKKVLSTFMAAYREAVDFMYSSDEALKIYAEFAGTDVATAKQIRDEFFPKSLIDPDRMSGMDQVMADAVTFKAISKPLDQEQIAKLIQIPPRQ
jgi:NitT/TauT family transport system substrate-binding protein